MNARFESVDLRSRFLPWWMWVIVSLQFILVFIYIVGTLLKPAAFLPDAQSLNYLVVLYVTRNATCLIGLLVAVLLRSHAALLVVLVIRFTTDSTDIVNALTLGDSASQAGIPFVIALLVIPAILGSVYLWRQIQNDSQR